MKRSLVTAAIASALTFTCAGLASAQEPYIGEVRMFGYNWCPVGWAPANGQLLPISQYTALFSLYGTNFGGNGQTNFALPDLRARAPVSFGSPPGLPPQAFATPYGTASVTLTVAQLPAHTHASMGSSQPNTEPSPAGTLFATFPPAQNVYAVGTSPANTPMSPTAIGITGGNQPVSTQSPALAMNWCVAMAGIFPSRP